MTDWTDTIVFKKEQMVRGIEAEQHIVEAHQRGRDEAERECIKAVCFHCGEHAMFPSYDPDTRWAQELWMHHPERCPAAGIYERRRQRAQEADDGEA